MNLHVDAPRQRVRARAPHCARADIEGGDGRCALRGRGEGDHAAAGAQIGHATSGREPGFHHHIDEQLRVLLRNVNLPGGDDDVARLLFVTRAKRIGLTLEQIAELLHVWDGVNCGTTYDRITGLVADKRSEIAERIRELQRFAQQLDEVGAALDEITPPATCRPDLSCCLPETNADAAIVVELIPRPRR